MALKFNRKTVLKALPFAGVFIVLICWIAFTIALNSGVVTMGDGATSPASEKSAEQTIQQANELRIGSLKGPTSIGLASMMSQGEGQFTVAASADEIAPKLIQGELDIALIPANLAATLFSKTNGALRVIDVNTLGVLYGLSQSTEATSIPNIATRTIYMTGKGTVPEYTFRALLEAYGISPDMVNIQFCSEPAEVIALISQDATAVGIVPQPYATAATMKNVTLNTVLDVTAAWESATGGQRGSLITGVTVTKANTLSEKKAAISLFLERHKVSTQAALSNPSAVAAKVAELGIIDSQAVAQSAIPLCNLVCYTGEQMKTALSAYLDVLYQQNAESVGGSLPTDAFYFIP